ncbi:hypothetical protein CEP54_011416 [Fusarium duplospermum]|uniref:Aminotransferase class I/classII large domain-containing protein n=1 Tax=Fusarium duplospermum TaxID=1325734 RepID=A0A428PEH8_9HYPO|nr:hypothetical protein CEP54_011416 [Fusarium duplospermum]
MSLSPRGRAAEEASDGLHIWKAVGNPYHPTTNPTGFATLGVSENTLMAQELSKHLHKHFKLPNHSFTYGDGMTGSKRLKAALATFLNRHLRPVLPLQSMHFTVTNGCSSAVEHLAWAIASPGDPFLLGRPYYNTLIPDLVLRTGCKVIAVDFDNTDPFRPEAVHLYEVAITRAVQKEQRVTGIIISSSHNPLGRCYSRATLLGLMSLCSNDEVYALSVWENKIDRNPEPVPFESCLSLDTTDVIAPDRVHTSWGLSKDFGANGLRIGVVISQSNLSLHAALVPLALYSPPSSASDHIAANILEDEKWTTLFIEKNQARLAERYQFVVYWANTYGVPYARGTNAAFFLWADLGSVWKKHNPGVVNEDLDDFLMKLFLDHKVYISSGKEFGSEESVWFRIVFS